MERLLKRRRFMFFEEQIKLLRQQSDEILSESVKLERVLGLTVASNVSLACSSAGHVIAYPAGCTVVLHGLKNVQRHIISPTKKNVTCLSFSSDGRYLAVGECGHEPVIRIWDVEEHVLLAELAGHKFALSCVAFSPNTKYLVSVGSQHDMVVNVWDWRNNVKVSSNKISSKVTALSFSENGDYFVTVGVRHVKFWYLDKRTSANKGRSAILADQRNNLFCDVCCGRGPTSSSTYCIAQSGLLCEFNSRRLLDKWVELKTRFAGSLCLGDDVLYVGCADGVIRVFKAADFHYVTNLPRPHYLGVDVAAGLSAKHMVSAPDCARYPDVIAVCFNAAQKKLISVYNDHSIYHWDVNDLKRIGKMASSLFHSSCIWNLETIAPPGSSFGRVPLETFITCSSDDTIRFWNLNARFSSDLTNPYHRNIYSQELLKVIYCDPELALLCDSALGSTLNAAGKSDACGGGTLTGRGGIRCVRLSPNGENLACGDRVGNIRVYDSFDLSLVKDLEAHDDEVLCLEYSDPSRGPFLLASSSRDRLMHLLDPTRMYAPLSTVDDHSSSVTCIHFTNLPDGQLLMVSCAADKSIICRRIDTDPKLVVSRMVNIVGPGTSFSDLAVDPDSNVLFAACQDRNIRVYSLLDGKLQRTIKASISEDGFLLKIELDSSKTFAAVSCSDKSVYVVDLTTEEFVASVSGHGEVVTDLKFVDDDSHLLTVSADSCIFVWKLEDRLTSVMRGRAAKKFANGFLEPRVTTPVNGFPAINGNGEPKVASPTAVAASQLPTRSTLTDRMSGGAGAAADFNVEKPSAMQLEGNLQTPALEIRTPSSDDTSTSFSDFDHQDAATRSFDVSNEAHIGADSSPVIYLQSSSQNANSCQFQVKDRSELLRASASSSFRSSDVSDDDSVQERLNELKAADSMDSLKLIGGHRDGQAVGDDVGESGFDGSSVSSSDTRCGGGNFERSAPDRNSMSSRFLQRLFPEIQKPKPMPEQAWPSTMPLRSNHSPRPSTSSSHTSSLSMPSSERPEYATDVGDATRRTGHFAGLRSKWKIDESPRVMSTRYSPTKRAPMVSTETTRAKSAGAPLNSQSMQRFSASLTNLLHCNNAKSTIPGGGDLAVHPVPVVSHTSRLSAMKRCDSMGSESSYESPSTAGVASSQKPSLPTGGDCHKIYSYFQPPPFPLQRQSSPWLPFPSSASCAASTRRDSICSNSRLQASISMSSLATSVGADMFRTAPSIKQLSEVREKLKKSYENLTSICNVSRAGGNEDGGRSPLPYVSRSKSFGDIVISSGGRRSSRPLANTPTLTTDAAANSGPAASRLNRFSKSLAKSVGCLALMDDDPGSRSLIDTIRDIKKISSSDLTVVGVAGSAAAGAAADVSSGSVPSMFINDSASSSDTFGFYSKSLTLPRSRHANGPAQKRAQHSRMASGSIGKKAGPPSGHGYNDSEDSSDASSRRPFPLSTKYLSPRRTSVSSDSPAFPTMRRMNTARGFRLSRRSDDPLVVGDRVAGPSRPMNYFSKILQRNNADDGHGSPLSDASFSPDLTPSSDSRWPGIGEMSDLSDSGDYTDVHFQKMYSHCKETRENFLTAVDKILQAYNLVLEDTAIPAKGQDKLLSVILSTVESVRTRLDHTLSQARYPLRRFAENKE